MKTYTATFHTDADFATREFAARSPKQALALARQLYEDDPIELMFESYDCGMAVHEIEICDDEFNVVAVWRDEDLSLRLAARDLLDAAQRVVDRWSDGDLAEAVRELAAAIAKAKDGAA